MLNITQLFCSSHQMLNNAGSLPTFITQLCPCWIPEGHGHPEGVLWVLHHPRPHLHLYCQGRSYLLPIYHKCVLILDVSREMFLVHHCYPWFCRSRLSHQQLLLGVVKESCFNCDINPPDCWPGLPHIDSLPSWGLPQCSQLWPHEGRQQLTNWHGQKGFERGHL